MHRINSRLQTLPLLTLIAAAFILGAAHAGGEKPANKLDAKIDDFQLKGADGKPMALYDLKDKKAVVVVFLSFECPVSTSYAPALAEMAKGYAEKGVAFLGVDDSDEGDAAAI